MGCTSWRAFSRLCGFASESQAKLMADTGTCEMAQLIKIRAATGVNLNWLICGGEDGGETIGLAVSPETEAERIAIRMDRPTDPTAPTPSGRRIKTTSTTSHHGKPPGKLVPAPRSHPRGKGGGL